MRNTFLTEVKNIIRKEPDTMFFTIDMGTWALGDLFEEYPDRAINFGIMEDGLISVAAGVAAQGVIPIIYGGWSFLIERALEQVKLDLVYQKLGANIVGTGAAFEYSKYGYSHYCPEDIAILKAIPGIEIVTPGNKKEFKKLFYESYRNGNTTFFRLTDHVTAWDADVEFGKAAVIKEGKKATVIAVGNMLDMVMEVCKNEDVTVLYYTTLAPFDHETLDAYRNEKILICQPFYRGSLLNEVYTPKSKIMEVGFPRDIYRNYGTYEDVLNHYNITAKTINHSLRKLYDL
jgi:transketolase